MCFTCRCTIGALCIRMLQGQRRHRMLSPSCAGQEPWTHALCNATSVAREERRSLAACVFAQCFLYLGVRLTSKYIWVWRCHEWCCCCDMDAATNRSGCPDLAACVAVEHRKRVHLCRATRGTAVMASGEVMLFGGNGKSWRTQTGSERCDERQRRRLVTQRRCG